MHLHNSYILSYLVVIDLESGKAKVDVTLTRFLVHTFS